MQPHRLLSWPLIVLSLTSCTTSIGSQSGATPPPANTRLVLIAAEPPNEQERTLLDLVRQRFPVVVQQGRFSTDDGVTNTCVYARRSSGRREMSSDANGIPFCPMIPTWLDGVSIGDAGTYLAHARAMQFESAELLNASDAMQRYGFSAANSDVLVLWTRGRGPHARK
jgi:hypothetical protein